VRVDGRNFALQCVHLIGEVMLCTEDQKSGIGLWHAVITVSWCGLCST